MGLAKEGARRFEVERVEERSLFESGLRSSAVEDAESRNPPRDGPSETKPLLTLVTIARKPRNHDNDPQHRITTADFAHPRARGTAGGGARTGALEHPEHIETIRMMIQELRRTLQQLDADSPDIEHREAHPQRS